MTDRRNFFKNVIFGAAGATFSGVEANADDEAYEKEKQNAARVLGQIKSLVASGPPTTFTVEDQFKTEEKDDQGIAKEWLLHWVKFKIDKDSDPEVLSIFEAIMYSKHENRDPLVGEARAIAIDNNLYRDAKRVYSGNEKDSIEDGFNISFRYDQGGDVLITIDFYDETCISEYLINGGGDKGIEVRDMTQPLSQEVLDKIKLRIIKLFADAYFEIQDIRRHEPEKEIFIINDPEDE